MMKSYDIIIYNVILIGYCNVYMLETKCFIRRNTLFLMEKHFVSPIETNFTDIANKQFFKIK